MAVRFTGNFYAFTGGDYTFTTRSDDGSMLFVDGQAVVISNVDQGMTTKAGLITLTPGVHALTVGFNENGGDQGLEVRYTPPGGVDQFIPNSVLPRYVSTKTLNLTTSSTVDLQNSVALPGALNHSPGVTLTTTAGTAVFPQVNLVAPSPAGPAAYTYAANGTVIVQDFADGGRPVTINKTGTGNLLLNATTPQFTNANDVINVTQGTVTALLGGTANANPLGQASLILNGGGLRVSSAGGDINFSKPFTISGNASLEAGNYGGGAVDGVKATFTNALNVASGQTLTTRSTSGYTLALKAVSGAGTLAVDGGLVALEGATNPNTVVVSSGVATVTSGTLSPAGGTSVNGTGILDFDPGTGVTANYAGGPIAINGGTIRAQSGIANLGTAPISFTPRSSTVVPNALLARLVDIGPAGSVFPGNTDAGINGGIAAPGIERPISAPISFLPYQAADGTFSTFFGGGNVDRFTAVFVGDFKAPVTGAYQAQIAQEDDNGGFWIDLNQNGIFESTGSAGNELMSGRGCCGDGPVGTANLVANQTYRVAMAVEDTGGGSSVVARAALPGGTLTTVNPGDAAQAGLWSYQQFSGGGNIQVAADAELRVNSLSGATDVNLIGSNATLRVSGASTVDVLRNTATFGETQTVDIAANQSLVAGRLVVSDNSTLIKAGAGTLTATTQGLSPNSTLQLDAGTIELNGPETATANTGMVAVNGGTLRVNGAISGTVNVAAAGTVEGPGRVGPLISAGIVSPGVAATPVGTLTTADLTLTGGTLRLDIQNTTAHDRLAVTGTVSLQNNPQLQAFLAGGTIAQGDLFFIVNNDGTDPVVGAFAGITNNGGPGAPGFTVLNGQAFFVSYFGDSATNAFDTAGGNDIVLRAVPEPQTWATVMSGIGALIGLQRFRRRR
jgi:hypothetical protein